MTSQRRFRERIEGSREVIFDLIADLPNYGRWLPGSQAFGAMTDVSPYPVRLGTTYLDAGPTGERPGSVTAFERPHRIAFHQTMLLKRGPLRADTEVQIGYTLEQEGGATEVVRTLDLTIRMSWPAKVVQPLVARAFHVENARTLAKLKRYVEAGGEPDAG